MTSYQSIFALSPKHVGGLARATRGINAKAVVF